MDATDDAFRALARSSPWRWRSVHFTYDGTHATAEAWVRRPGEQLVRVEGREDQLTDDRERRLDGATAPILVRPAPRRYGFPSRRRRAAVAPPRRRPHEVEPTRRPDGLVAVRPSDHDVEYDDPMYQSYDWVAMLDPVELSHHTTVAQVRASDRRGRPTWWARVSPQEGYEPRCGCCPLLWSEISDRDEEAGGDPAWRPDPGTTYPEAYDVALDVQTGIVVERAPVGPASRAPWHTLELLAVDTDLSSVLGPDRG